MKKVIFAILVIFAGALLAQTIITFRQEQKLKNDLTQMTDEYNSIQKENADLKAQVDYFSNPQNLEKELRSKFNYKKPDEQMMIITQ